MAQRILGGRKAPCQGPQYKRALTAPRWWRALGLRRSTPSTAEGEQMRSGARGRGIAAVPLVVATLAAVVLAGSATAVARPARGLAGTTAEHAAPARGAAATAGERAALAEARATGRRVELTELRGERVRVFANPAGTLTAELAAQPVRVRRADGSWVPVSTELRAR